MGPRRGAPLSQIKLLGRHSDLRAARMLDRTRIGLRVSRQNIEQGRLPCAIAPDQPDLLPCLDRERRAGEDFQVSTMVLYEISCDNHLHATEIIQT